MEITVYISLAAVCVSFLGLYMNNRKETKGDAAKQARLEAKLDSVVTGVDDLRVELRMMRETMKDHGERLATMESTIASNCRRLDALEKRAQHPPNVD